MSQYPTFPELSRQPKVKGVKGQYIDPTLRSDLANGMEKTRSSFKRARRQYAVSYDLLTCDDWATLEDFIEKTAVYGANIFLFPDNRDPANPKMLMVRFSVLPKDDDGDYADGQPRIDVNFELRTV